MSFIERSFHRSVLTHRAVRCTPAVHVPIIGISRGPRKTTMGAGTDRRRPSCGPSLSQAGTEEEQNAGALAKMLAWARIGRDRHFIGNSNLSQFRAPQETSMSS
jgi:hypothetical protein